MFFYELSLAKIVIELLAKFPQSQPKETNLDEYPHRKMDHVYWMAIEMKGWESSSRKQNHPITCFINWALRPLGMQLYDVAVVKRATKAGRWMGWMLRIMEEAKVWNNEESRRLTRWGVESGEDLPH
jgi:hypothetical protein